MDSMIIAEAIVTTFQTLDLTATFINGQASEFRTASDVMGLRANAHPLSLGQIGRLSVQTMHMISALVRR